MQANSAITDTNRIATPPPATEAPIMTSRLESGSVGSPVRMVVVGGAISKIVYEFKFGIGN